MNEKIINFNLALSISTLLRMVCTYIGLDWKEFHFVREASDNSIVIGKNIADSVAQAEVTIFGTTCVEAINKYIFNEDNRVSLTDFKSRPRKDDRNKVDDFIIGVNGSSVEEMKKAFNNIETFVSNKVSK